MLRRRYKTREDALKAAHEYLSKEAGEYYITDKSVYMENDAGENEELFTIVSIKDSSSFAMIIRLPFQEDWTLKAYRNVKFTYPFRGINERGLYVLCSSNAVFWKPSKEITPDEARTPEGAREIYSFFGTRFVETPQEVIEDEDGRLFFYSNLSALMEDVAGKRINSIEDYLEAISLRIGKELDDDLKEQARGSYLYTQSEYFLTYAFYEFLRTEKYERLTEVLSHYETFGLPKDWASRHFPLSKAFESRNTGAEEYVLTRYLNNEARELIGVKSYRELADITGTPITLIYKILKSRDIW